MNFSEFLKALNFAKIGGKSHCITPAITTTASAYTSGDCVGGIIRLNNVMSCKNGTAVIKSIFVRDNSNQSAPLTVLIFNSLPTGATYTDNSSFSYGSTSFANQIAKIDILADDYQTVDSKAIANIDTVSTILQSNDNEDLWAVIITTGTPTYGANSTSLSITFSFLVD